MTVAPVTDALSLPSELLESDSAYFDTGALVEPIEGGSLAWLPGLEALPAGAVVHRMTPGVIRGGAESWVASVEAVTRVRGIPRLRLYLQQSDPKLERALRARHYAERREIGLVRSAAEELHPPDPAPLVRLEEIVDLTGWDDKRRVTDACPTAPDGHPADPKAWCEMEQRRSAHGYMRPFLIRHGDSACGTLCLAPRGRMLRLKNLLIHPAWRGRGIATSAVNAAVLLARRAGFHTVGCFAIPGGPALAVWQRTGFAPTVVQSEWMQP